MSVVISDAWRQRFGGTARLYGEKALQLFADAHICVVGIGGVGSWAAEALARFPGKVVVDSFSLISDENDQPLKFERAAVEKLFGKMPVVSREETLREATEAPAERPEAKEPETLKGRIRQAVPAALPEAER